MEAIREDLTGSTVSTITNYSVAPPVIVVNPSIFPEGESNNTDGLPAEAYDPSENDDPIQITNQPETSEPETSEPETADPDQTAGEPADPSGEQEPQQSNDAGESNEPDSSAQSGAGAGHWAGSDGTVYANVASTNYRYKWTAGSHSVVRQTTKAGKFYITDAHMVKFTVQFARASNLRLWQTGNSYLFSQPQYRMENATDTATKAGIDSDTNKKQLLAKRYSTTWMMYDNANPNTDGTVNMSSNNKTSDEAGYTAWTNAGNSKTTSGTGANANPYSFLMDYVNHTADENAFVDVYVVYTNTVLTGNVKFTKTATTAEAAANPDKNYTFNVAFSNVFGGGSGSAPYVGEYKLYNKDNTQIAADGTASSDALNTNNGTITLKAGWSFVIEGVPVMTNYSITEQLPANSTTVVKSAQIADIKADGTTVTGKVNSDDYESGTTTVTFKPNRAGVLTLTSVGSAGNYQLNGGSDTAIPADRKVTLSNATDSVSVAMAEITEYKVTFAPSDGSSAVNWTVYETAYGSKVESLNASNTAVSGQVRADHKDDAWDGDETYPLSNYTDGTNYKSYVAYSARDGAYASTLENDITSATIILRKQIDKRYYYTKEYDDAPDDDDKAISDNPAGFYGSLTTVGGQAPDVAGNDANAYQKATNAVQTFIYKIEEFKPGATSGTYESNANRTFYETISFDSSDNLNTFKYRLIDADPSCKYVITEISDWSWKYKPNEDSAKKTAVEPTTEGNVATSTDSSQNYYEVVITKFATVTIPPVDKNGKIASGDDVPHSNSAMASYYNTKDAADKDIEGDTYISENTATKAS